METVLVVPGLQGSGPAHWQTWMQAQVAGAERVEQTDWQVPDLAVWSAAVRAALVRQPGPVWVVAHSFGCLATAAVLAEFRPLVAGVMLVAPADPYKFGVMEALPARPFGVPAVVVASTNDPWIRMMRAVWLADRWGCRLLDIGAQGHINVESGHGPWPEGLAIFEALRASAACYPLGAVEPLDAAQTLLT